MANNYFRFKQFTIIQDKSVFKVTTDGVLLGALADIPYDGDLLDIGTGTGLIAIMAAQRSRCNIVAIEPHRDSYLQACENVSACPWSSRIKVENISFNEFYNRSDMQFDFIIANPPYFINSLLNPDKSKASARHAFSLTPDDLFSGSSFLLKESGSLQVILPYPEGTLFISAAAERGLYCNNIIRIKAVPSGPVIRLILKFEKKKRQTRESFLTIETGSIPKYTDAYIRATRDFYLNF